MKQLAIETPHEFNSRPFETVDRLNYLTALGAAHAFSLMEQEMAMVVDRRWSEEHRRVIRQAFDALTARVIKTPLFKRALECERKS